MGRFRYLLGKKADFTSLDGYVPDNSRVDERLIPSKMQCSTYRGDGFKELAPRMKNDGIRFPYRRIWPHPLCGKGFYIVSPWAVEEDMPIRSGEPGGLLQVHH